MGPRAVTCSKLLSFIRMIFTHFNSSQKGRLYTGFNTSEKFSATGCFKVVDGKTTEGFSKIKVYVRSTTSE